MEVNETTFTILTEAKFGLTSSGKNEIICHAPDEKYFIFFYPENDILHTRKVLGRNSEYNMPIIDSVPDREFKVESNEALKQLLEDLCK